MQMWKYTAETQTSSSQTVFIKLTILLAPRNSPTFPRLFAKLPTKVAAIYVIFNSIKKTCTHGATKHWHSPKCELSNKQFFLMRVFLDTSQHYPDFCSISWHFPVPKLSNSPTFPGFPNKWPLRVMLHPVAVYLGPPHDIKVQPAYSRHIQMNSSTSPLSYGHARQTTDCLKLKAQRWCQREEHWSQLS